MAALWATGCAPAGVLTSARTLKPGAFEHVASLEPQLALYQTSRVDQVQGKAQPIDDSAVAPAISPGYSLRAGVVEGFELGGKLTPHSFELNTKMALLDHKRVALAIAPRVHNGAYAPLLPPYYVRMPLLLTVDVTSWLSLTPRFGTGVVLGTAHVLLNNMQSASSGTDRFPLRDLLLEAGLGALFHVSPRVSLVFEPYALATPFNSRLTSAAVGLGLIVRTGGD